MDSIDSFFNEFSIQNNKLYSDGNKNLSIDGTGILPSVDESAAIAILNYIKKNYTETTNILDIGSGVGWLSNKADNLYSYYNMKCYSFEGCKDLVPHIKCSPNKYAIVDLSKKFTDERLNKKFDLTTSFEVLEHIHRDHQDIFWENLRFFSKGHLCSIHVANQEDHEHCCIRPLNEWIEYLKQIGNVTVLGKHPNNLDDNDNDFRKETGLNNWDCSIMLYGEFY
jgi:hypothetical protein